MFRRFLIAVVIFLIAVVVVADRVGALVGAHVLATKVQKDEGLRSRPDASIGGFPFLNQAVSGKYKNVTITAHDVPVDGVNVTTLTAHLRGVHLPFSKVLGGSVSQVPVDRVDGTAFVSYADANSYLSHHLVAGARVSLSPGTGGTVSVVDRLRLTGKVFTLHGVGSASTDGNVVTIAVTHLRGSTSSADSLGQQTEKVALKHLKVVIPLRTIPFRMNITSVTATSAGLSGAATASHIVLGADTH